MKPISDFFKGLTMRHVDYATRHHSRAYDIGGNVGAAAILTAPFLIAFGLGYLVRHGLG